MLSGYPCNSMSPFIFRVIERRYSMVASGKMQFVSILLLTILTAVLIGANRYEPLLSGEPVELFGPYVDEGTGTMTVAVRIRSGHDKVRDAQNSITRGLDMLSQADGDGTRKVLLVAPGHYIFSRPVIYRQHHLGIDIVGAPEVTRALTESSLNPETVRDDIARIRPQLPVIDGDGVSSFLVIDGVTSGAHLNAKVTGFYFIDQMAGLGGSHYPDFSYRLQDGQFMAKGGYYTRYAYNDGGVISVLGNSSVVFTHNIVDGAMAFQCGGVLRNEQYGAPGSMDASIVTRNIVIDPFAWHTGSFLDNNTGSYIVVSHNQILIDRQIPHEIDMITNFDNAFMVAEDNRIIDARADKSIAVVGIRMLGPQGGIVMNRNTFEGISQTHYYNSEGSPPFPENRDFYFLVNKGKILKMLKYMTSPETLPLIRPGQWPDHMKEFVRTSDLDDDNPLRISALKMHFARYKRDRKG
jgi:hypothetical protein